MNRARNLGGDALRISGISNFGCDDQSLRAAARIRRAECHHATRAHSGDSRRDFFDLVRIKISAALDNHVLCAPGDEEFAISPVRAVAGIEPASFALSARASPSDSVIATRCRRAAEPKLALDSFTRVVTFGRNDAAFHVRERRPCTDKFQRRRTVCARGNRAPR